MFFFLVFLVIGMSLQPAKTRNATDRSQTFPKIRGNGFLFRTVGADGIHVSLGTSELGLLIIGLSTNAREIALGRTTQQELEDHVCQGLLLGTTQELPTGEPPAEDTTGSEGPRCLKRFRALI
ncbi:uncharacterized protein F4807DRAFT_415748, partial [Annulohypoxylon truncatum]|uniref:uncharacterized protein n=1 Tax=Annulohypoxylon truncatum TaxID=327061 RepID=UPI00200762CA